jgi:hypothetical protein
MDRWNLRGMYSNVMLLELGVGDPIGAVVGLWCGINRCVAGHNGHV